MRNEGSSGRFEVRLLKSIALRGRKKDGQDGNLNLVDNEYLSQEGWPVIYIDGLRALGSYRWNE